MNPPRLPPAALLALVLLAAAFPAASPAVAQIVNLDATQNVVGADVDQPLAVPLAAGAWLVRPIGTAQGGAWDAFSPWSSNANCDPLCGPGPYSRGYTHQYGVRIGTDLIVDPIDTWNGYYYSNPTAALAVALPSTINLAAPATVQFFVPADLPVDDNRGGISLQLVNTTPTRAWSWGQLKIRYR
jgi:hypothetical protein